MTCTCSQLSARSSASSASSRRALQQLVVLDRLARLRDQVGELLVVGQHRHRARMLDDLPLDLAPVSAAVALGDEVDVLAVVQWLAAQQLHGRISHDGLLTLQIFNTD